MSTVRYIDTHSHLHFPQYDTDRAEVIARMRDAGVATIAVGTGSETSRGAVALANEHADIFASIGIHPTDFDEPFEETVFAEMLGPKVVAVGECGLDYFRGDRAELRAKQSALFEAQIHFALEHNLPLMLHVRPSAGTQDAHEDALDILESVHRQEGDRLRGNTHFFTGSLETAARYWDIGFTTAFPGVITFTHEYDEVVKTAPRTMILSETDAPYATPEPHRGRRNEPVYVIETIRHMAGLRNEPLEALEEQLLENARRVFRIAL